MTEAEILTGCDCALQRRVIARDPSSGETTRWETERKLFAGLRYERGKPVVRTSYRLKPGDILRINGGLVKVWEVRRTGRYTEARCI